MQNVPKVLTLNDPLYNPLLPSIATKAKPIKILCQVILSSSFFKRP